MNEMKTANAIAKMVIDRAQVGLEKYGVTVDRNDLIFEEWCQHAIEELLDATQYIQRMKEVYTEKTRQNNSVIPVSYNELIQGVNGINCDYRDTIHPKDILKVYKYLLMNGHIVKADNNESEQ